MRSGRTSCQACQHGMAVVADSPLVGQAAMAALNVGVCSPASVFVCAHVRCIAALLASRLLHLTPHTCM